MPDNKLTDNEIIKACKNCIHFTTCIFCNGGGCTAKDCGDYIEADLINNLQAENENLYKTINNMASSVGKINEKLPLIKTEAYKECIEMVKKISTKKKIVYVVDVSLQEQETGWLEIREEKLDNLLKELEDDNK